VSIDDGGNSITVDYATTGSGTATGALRVELPTNGTGVLATVGAVTSITNTVAVGGTAAADAAVSGNPVQGGGRASAAAPTDVSADGDAVPSWHLRNGAQAVNLTAAGALIGGDATNGLDVDITRNAALVAGSAVIGKVGIDQTTPGTTNLVMASGTAADDAAAVGGPVQSGGVAQTSDPAMVTAGDAAYSLHTIGHKQVVMPYAISGSRWSYAAASGGLVNTTAVTIKAAAASGIKNCLTSIQVINGHATVSTEVLIRDGAAGTVLHRGWAQAAGGGYAYELPVPICGTAATLLEAVNVTTGSAVYVNAQGYISAE
jgi:hypothetical protein